MPVAAAASLPSSLTTKKAFCTKLLALSTPKLRCLVHHVNIKFFVLVSGEWLLFGICLVKLLLPISFEVNCIDKHHASTRLDRPGGEQILDFLFSLLLHPFIDHFTGFLSFLKIQ